MMPATPVRKGLAVKNYTSAIFTVLLCTATLHGQTETGQITGTVLDQSGAVIANAAITAVEPATKVTRTLKTGAAGLYVFPNLLPGRYEVSATANGFQTTKQTVTVTVGAQVGLDFHLQVGTQTQIVEVQEQITRVNTENQAQGTNISGREIIDVPTITRNPYDLVQKTVANTTNSDPEDTGNPPGSRCRCLDQRAAFLRRRHSFGRRSEQQQFRYDGGAPDSPRFRRRSYGSHRYVHRGVRARPGGESSTWIRSAAKTHSMGPPMNLIAYPPSTSNTYENNATGIPISPFTRNQFGFSLGGPFKKDKLFFFGNPEWLRVRSVAIQEAAIPTTQLIAASAPATQQFFSAYGTLAPNVTPLQTFTYSKACTNTAICTLLPGNTPAYQLVAFGVPSDSGGGAPGNTFSFAGRVDYVMTDTSQLYFRYARYYRTVTAGDVNASPYLGYNTGENDTKDAYALSFTRILSPNVVSQTKLSFNRITIIQPPRVRSETNVVYDAELDR